MRSCRRAGRNSFGQLGRPLRVLHRVGKWAHPDFPARHLRRRAQRMQAADDFAFHRRRWNRRQRRQQLSLAERQRPLCGFQFRSHQSCGQCSRRPPDLFARHLRWQRWQLFAIHANCFHGFKRLAERRGKPVSVHQRFRKIRGLYRSVAEPRLRVRKRSSRAKNSGYRQVFVRDTCLGASLAHRRPRVSRCNLATAATTSKSARARRSVRAVTTSRWQDKPPHSSRVPWRLMIASSWPSPNPRSNRATAN